MTPKLLRRHGDEKYLHNMNFKNVCDYQFSLIHSSMTSKGVELKRDTKVSLPNGYLIYPKRICLKHLKKNEHEDEYVQFFGDECECVHLYVIISNTGFNTHGCFIYSNDRLIK